MYRWLNPLSQAFLDKDYLLPGQSIDSRVDVICRTAECILGDKGPKNFAARFKANIQQGWYSLSTPVWTNFGNGRGLPISCYNSYFSDSIASLLGSTHAEIAMMTKQGGGTSGYYGDVRGRGESITDNGKSFGSVHFAKHHESLIQTCSQGSTRRGNYAGYWPIDHKDIEEVLGIKSEGHPIQDINYGVCVKDEWLQAMVDGDQSKRKTWAKLLSARMNNGLPYLFFTDTVNRTAPPWYTDRGYKIRCSNLCAEVTPTSNEDESYVCCLASMNVRHFDEWKFTDAVELMVYFLDAVLTEFIEKAKHIPFMERAVRYAERHRSIGIGWLGWHSLLQSKMVPFESMEAKKLNAMVALTIRHGAVKASEAMADVYGESEVTKGYGQRHALLQAIAPTKSSAFILGQMSEGIEPEKTNYYLKDLAKGKFPIQNPFLKTLLAEKGHDTNATWDSILKAGGSVQNLACLDAHEKAVFKTFGEISQLEVIQQAAQRQRYIDQSQSLNLMIHPSVSTKDLNTLVLEAWRSGVKTLYYQHSLSAAQSFARDIMSCSSCEA